MSLVLDVFVGSLGIAGMTMCQTSDCSVRHQNLLPAYRQRQHLYGHVARFLEADLSHRALSVRDNTGWRRPMGRPQGLWLGQINASCRYFLSMKGDPS